MKVRCAGDVTIEARHLVAADGHWSTVRRQLHPDEPRDLGTWHAARQYFDGVDDERLWVLFEEDLLPGYAWVFPMPGGGANVGFGVLRAGRHGRELKELWADVLAPTATARDPRPRRARARRRCARGRSPPRTRPRDSRTDRCSTPATRRRSSTRSRAKGSRRRSRQVSRRPTRSQRGGDADAVAPALPRHRRPRARSRSAVRAPTPADPRVTARRARVDQGRRLVRLDPPQLRPVAVRGVSARGAVHAGPVAPAALHSAGRLLPDSRDSLTQHSSSSGSTTREHDMADGKTEVTIAKPPDGSVGARRPVRRPRRVDAGHRHVRGRRRHPHDRDHGHGDPGAVEESRRRDAHHLVLDRQGADLTRTPPRDDQRRRERRRLDPRRGRGRSDPTTWPARSARSTKAPRKP